VQSNKVNKFPDVYTVVVGKKCYQVDSMLITTLMH